MRGIVINGKMALRLGWLALVGLVAIAYANGLNAPFVYDDRIEVVGNATIRDLGQWRAVLEYNVSRLLLILTYAWNFQLWGLDPVGYHAFSLGVHALTVGAALAMALQVGRLAGQVHAAGLAMAAVALWAIHPMGTEAVTYITGRSESLCALFVFAALAAWAAALRNERDGDGDGDANSLRVLALVLCLLGMLTKEVAASTPLAMLAMERWLGSGDRRVRWSWYLPLVGLWCLGITGRALYAETLLPREVDRALPVQLATQAEVWLRYLGLWLFPVGQTLYHHVPDVNPLSVRGAGVVLGWLAVVVSLVRFARTRPLVAWALISAALFLLPASSVVPLKESMAEHRAYQLGLYLCLALAWSIPQQWQRFTLWFALVLVPVLMAATIQRNKVWSSEVGLWEEATGYHPDVAEAWYGLGDARRFQGNFDEATKAYERATDLDPQHLDSWNNLGIARAEIGDDPGARTAWRRALRVSRTYCKAHANLGFLALENGEEEAAIVELRTTLAYCPNNLVAHYGLGLIYFEERRNPERAIQHFEALLEIDPSFSRAEEVRTKLLQLTW